MSKTNIELSVKGSAPGAILVFPRSWQVHSAFRELSGKTQYPCNLKRVVKYSRDWLSCWDLRKKFNRVSAKVRGWEWKEQESLGPNNYLPESRLYSKQRRASIGIRLKQVEGKVKQRREAAKISKGSLLTAPKEEEVNFTLKSLSKWPNLQTPWSKKNHHRRSVWRFTSH